MGKVRVTLKSASLCSYIPMTRIIYQLNQFDKRKYLVWVLSNWVWMLSNLLLTDICTALIPMACFWFNVKQRLLTLVLNSILIFVARPYWKSQGKSGNLMWSVKWSAVLIGRRKWRSWSCRRTATRWRGETTVDACLWMNRVAAGTTSRRWSCKPSLDTPIFRHVTTTVPRFCRYYGRPME